MWILAVIAAIALVWLVAASRKKRTQFDTRGMYDISDCATIHFPSMLLANVAVVPIFFEVRRASAAEW